MSHQAQRLLEAKTLHELSRRLSDKGLEHAVKVERREHRGSCQFPQSERFMEMFDDMVEGAIDSLDVRHGRGKRVFLQGSQDLASPQFVSR